MATVTRYANLLLTFFVGGVFIYIDPYLLQMWDGPSFDKPLVTVQATQADEEELVVDEAAVSNRCWSKLGKAGYTGQAGDGLEAFYVTYSDLSDICGKTVAAKVAEKQDNPADDTSAGSRTAEDGSKVNKHFYDRTDYNRNGVADQDEGFPKNPSMEDVQAGRK